MFTVSAAKSIVKLTINKYIIYLWTLTAFGELIKEICFHTQPDATINRKIYCFVVQTLLNMFRASQCPSSRARQTSTFIWKPEAATEAARLLRSWVRIPPGAWVFVCCECRVLSGRCLCDELVTRPEESYRLCCVVVCDLETSRIGAPYIYRYMTLEA